MTLDYNLNELDTVAQKIINNSTFKTLLFYGDVGAGKTTLIKALVKTLGSSDTVSSPTFSLVNEYIIPTNESPIFHFDLYRINTEDELYNIGIETYLESDSWVFIEWPSLILPLLQNNYHKIEIITNTTLKRQLSFNTI